MLAGRVTTMLLRIGQESLPPIVAKNRRRPAGVASDNALSCANDSDWMYYNVRRLLSRTVVTNCQFSDEGESDTFWYIQPGHFAREQWKLTGYCHC
jgi:hypothetical protein